MSTAILQLNQWRVQLDSGELTRIDDFEPRSETHNRLDPKALALLVALANKPNAIFTKEQLFALLWPQQVVTDDALTRCVSRLRKSLQDDPKAAQIIETIPRRGYRLIANTVYWLPQDAPSEIAAKFIPGESQSIGIKSQVKTTWGLLSLAFAAFIFIAFALLGPWFLQSNQKALVAHKSQGINDVQPLLRQADDYYSQIRRQDNEMAIELYQQVMALKPEIGAGQAGLANALVQQVLRWPNAANDQAIYTRNLQHALQAGRTDNIQAQQKLNRALALAKNAVAQAPQSARAYKALGFVFSALREFDQALHSYQMAIELDPSAWDALINYGDVLEIMGNLPEAMVYYQRAFEAMQQVQVEQSARINPWLADFGARIGDKYLSMDEPHEAEIWYRKVLSFAPFNSNATRGLVRILSDAGDTDTAQRFCLEYLQRIGTDICNL